MNDFKENVFIDLLTTCQLVKKMYSELEKKYCINFMQLAIIFLSGTRNIKKGITIKEEMMALIKKRNGEIEKLMGTENANQFGLLLETLNETLESINNEGGE